MSSLAKKKFYKKKLWKEDGAERRQKMAEECQHKENNQ